MGSFAVAATARSPVCTTLDHRPHRRPIPPTDVLACVFSLEKMTASNAAQKFPRRRSDRPRRNGGKKHRRWAGGVSGQGAERSARGASVVANSFSAGGNPEVSGVRWRSAAEGEALGRDAARRCLTKRGGALPLKTAMSELPSKLGWLSDGWVVLRSVRDEKVVGNIGRLCAALDEDTFEVTFNDRSLEQLLAAGLQYPTDLPNGGRFMRKFGGRGPAPLANLSTHDFDDWTSMHRVADDMLYIISLGLGQGGPPGKRRAGVGDGRGAAVIGEDAGKGAPTVDEDVGDAGGAGGAAGWEDAEAVIKGEPYVMLGPTLIRSKGECPQQLMHVDNIRPSEMLGTDAPKLSLLMAVQNGTKVDEFSGSHRFLPAASGGSMTKPIPCTTVIIDAGDVLIFRQDLVHLCAASIGLSHRWHW